MKPAKIVIQDNVSQNDVDASSEGVVCKNSSRK